MGGAFFKNKKDTFDWRLKEGDSHLGGLLGQRRVFWSVPVLRPLESSCCHDCSPEQLLHRGTWSISAFIYLELSLCQPLNMSHALSALSLPPLRWPLLHFTGGTKAEGGTIAGGHHSIAVQRPDSKGALRQSPVIRLWVRN